MQQILTVQLGEEEILSRPFDFEAMCLVNDAHNTKEGGELTICREAVSYLFEGTKVTDKVIEALPLEERAGLCMKVWKFYVEAMGKARKNA